MLSMKKFLALILLSTIPIGSFAQNLVPNPSFEVFTDLSTIMGNGDLEYAAPWFDTPAFPGGGGASPDYIHINMPLTLYNGDTYEFQSPHSGFGMAGFASCTYSSVYNSSEPIEVRLEEPLVLGEQYLVSFYVKKADYYGVGQCHYGSDELGVYFHTDTIYSSAAAEEHQNTEEIENALKLYEHAYELEPAVHTSQYEYHSNQFALPQLSILPINHPQNWSYKPLMNLPHFVFYNI